jgi:glycosyltransferase involved in cell wall biosynthesis
MQPILSIVIPTRNRLETASLCVRQVLAFEDPDLEVVVQDCSDTLVLQDWLSHHICDGRLKYRHAGRAVSMTENWNLAMQAVSGRYVTFIGDDDGVSPEAVPIARWAEARGIDTVTAAGPFFYWPNFPNPLIAGRIVFGDYRLAVVFPNNQRELARCASSGGERIENLPSIYYGLVSSEAMTRLRERSGTWFDSFAPDYYTNFALAGVATRSVVIDYPLFIIGKSGKSNTARTIRSESHQHLEEYAHSTLDDLVPNSPWWRACVGDAMAKALRRVGRQDLLSRFDLPEVYSQCLVHDPRRSLDHLSRFVRAMNGNDRSRFSNWRSLVRKTAYLGSREAARRVVRRFIPKSFAPAGTYVPAEDILAAAQRLCEWRKSQALTIDSLHLDD